MAVRRIVTTGTRCNTGSCCDFSKRFHTGPLLRLNVKQHQVGRRFLPCNLHAGPAACDCVMKSVASKNVPSPMDVTSVSVWF